MDFLKMMSGPRVVRAIFLVLAFATPLIGALGAFVDDRDRSRRSLGGTTLLRQPIFWLLSASGPILWALWKQFNAIEDALGLDSVVGLFTCLALFCAEGFAISLFLFYGKRWMQPRAPQTEAKQPNDTHGRTPNGTPGPKPGSASGATPGS